MFLNADILMENLPADLRAQMTGTKTLDLALRRPELYEGGEAPFRANHLYLLTADRVPQRAQAERGCVIVSIGESLRLERYRMRCCVIVVDKDADFYRTFNLLQQVFDRFDAWEADLRRVLEEGADIPRLLAVGEAVFENPVRAIDGSFRVLGSSPLAEALNREAPIRPEEDGSMSLAAIGQFLELHNLSMEEREPLVLTLLDETTLNYNLFVEDEYRGCVTVQYTRRTYRPGDKPLVAVLGQYLVRAIRQLAAHSPEGLGSLRQAVQDLVEERPLSGVARSVIDGENDGRRFLCVRLKAPAKSESVPLGFVRNTVEAAFARSIVFEYHRNSVVAVLDAESLGEGDRREALRRGLEPFTGSMDMRAGVSRVYGNLLLTRGFFLQADRALDLGTLFEAEERCHFFEDFALRSMVMNAPGEMDLELLFPEGLTRLLAHDAASATSYVETLRVYLENNLSVAKTAKDLYVHRSTLMERLERIRRELGMDLDDPDVQLELRLLLRAMQIGSEMRPN